MFGYISGESATRRADAKRPQIAINGRTTTLIKASLDIPAAPPLPHRQTKLAFS